MSNIEILCGGNIKSAFESIGINADKTYNAPKKEGYPNYQVYEISKQDLHKLEDAEEWDDNWGWWKYSKRSNLGTPFEFFTVNGQFMIGWETADKTDTYDNLLDYLTAINISTKDDICSAIVDIGRTNGMNMSKVFKTYYG